jgi:glyoxylase-like metal-dependent hydrolase (beta-lactamase superfamily II)/rhodanese-related sulfurtransferase
VSSLRVGDLHVEVVETPTLGDRSYVVHDGTVAAVVDPQRDTDRVHAVLDRLGLRVLAVLETHVHNDYVTGGLALAEATGASYHLHGEDRVAFSHEGLRDGDVVAVGDRIRLTALATPGHTFTHLAYALTDGDAGLDQAVAVFTGGSLLFGATGRPDLLGAEHTEDLARHQHASAHRLADLLPDSAAVLPTHGFGSFCAATQSEATSSTIGDERRANPVLTQDEATYVEELVGALGAFPAYYAHMGPANAAGPTAPDLSPAAPADPAELRRRLEAGEWLVDLRDRTAFAAGHLRGSYNFGIDGGFATYLGWLVAWGTPLTLLADTADDVAEAQRELVRIGIDRPAAQATGGPSAWSLGDDVTSFERATLTDLAQVRHHRHVTVLDVRRDDEHAESAIVGSVHVPLHQLLDRIGEVPAGEVWVHCASGYRASIGASLLDAAGIHVVAVDDEWDNAAASGLPLAPGGA